MLKTLKLVKKYNSLKNKITTNSEEDLKVLNDTLIIILGYLNKVSQLKDINKEEFSDNISFIENAFNKLLSKLPNNQKTEIISFFEFLDPLNPSENIKKQKKLFINSIATEFIMEESIILNLINTEEEIIDYMRNISCFIPIIGKEVKSKEVLKTTYNSLENKLYTLELIHEFTVDITSNIDDDDFF